MVEQARKSWGARAWAFPRTVVTGAFARLKTRYGRGYASVILWAAFLASLSPVPGSSLIGAALVVGIAELHRTISRGGALCAALAHLPPAVKATLLWPASGRKAVAPVVRGAAETYQRRPVMSIDCEVILQWGATPAQLQALGAAFWAWGTRGQTDSGIYPYLDNQILADLIDGRLPPSPRAPRQAGRPLPRFRIRDERSDDRQGTIASLRRAVPTGGVADIVVDGVSWGLAPRETETPGSL